MMTTIRRLLLFASLVVGISMLLIWITQLSGPRVLFGDANANPPEFMSFVEVGLDLRPGPSAPVVKWTPFVVAEDGDLVLRLIGESFDPWQLPKKLRYEVIHRIDMPLLPTVAGCAFVAAAAIIPPRLRRRHRRAHNLCPTCGYNLTSNTTGICPECGMRPSSEDLI